MHTALILCSLGSQQRPASCQHAGIPNQSDLLAWNGAFVRAVSSLADKSFRTHRDLIGRMWRCS